MLKKGRGDGDVFLLRRRRRKKKKSHVRDSFVTFFASAGKKSAAAVRASIVHRHRGGFFLLLLRLLVLGTEVRAYHRIITLKNNNYLVNKFTKNINLKKVRTLFAIIKCFVFY